jgi:hypothetical protein
MATVPLTLNPGRTALLMADFHREGMGDNPIAQERGTVQTSRAVLEAARQARMLVERIVSPLQVDWPTRRRQAHITTAVSPTKQAEISCHEFTIRSTSRLYRGQLPTGLSGNFRE